MAIYNFVRVCPNHKQCISEQLNRFLERNLFVIQVCKSNDLRSENRYPAHFGLESGMVLRVLWECIKCICHFNFK